MQLSAANLLIASQQLARPAAATSANAQAQFAAAIAKEKGVDAAFEPMAFRQMAPGEPAPSAPSPRPDAGYRAGTGLGAQLDIRV